jgi:hypothetical protein
MSVGCIGKPVYLLVNAWFHDRLAHEALARAAANFAGQAAVDSP